MKVLHQDLMNFPYHFQIPEGMPGVFISESRQSKSLTDQHWDFCFIAHHMYVKLIEKKLQLNRDFISTLKVNDRYE